MSELIQRAEAAEGDLALAHEKVSSIEREMQASGSGSALLASEKASLEVKVKKLQKELHHSHENVCTLNGIEYGNTC